MPRDPFSDIASYEPVMTEEKDPFSDIPAPPMPQVANEVEDPFADIEAPPVPVVADQQEDPFADIEVPELPRQQGATPAALLPPQGIKDTKRPMGEPTSTLGTLAREIGLEAIPTRVGLAGGFAAAKLSLPLAAALSPATAGISTVAVPLIAGLAGAIGAGWLAQKGQSLGLEKIMGEEKFAELQARREQAAEEHPVASFVGGFIPALATMGIQPRNVLKAGRDAARIINMGKSAKTFIQTAEGGAALTNLINVSVGGGTQAGQEAYNQVQQGDFQPIRLMGALTIGALMNDPKFGKKLPYQVRRLAQQADIKATVERIRAATKEGLPPSPQAAATEGAPVPVSEAGRPPPKPPEGIPTGKVSVDKTMVQELVDMGLSKKDAIQAVRDTMEAQNANQVKGPVEEIRGGPQVETPANRVAEPRPGEVREPARAQAKAKPPEVMTPQERKQAGWIEVWHGTASPPFERFDEAMIQRGIGGYGGYKEQGFFFSKTPERALEAAQAASPGGEFPPRVEKVYIRNPITKESDPLLDSTEYLVANPKDIYLPKEQYQEAVQTKRSISAYGTNPPEGYVREGDRYVFRGEAAKPKGVTLEVKLYPDSDAPSARDVVGAAVDDPQAKRFVDVTRQMDKDVHERFKFSFDRWRNKMSSWFRNVPAPIFRKLKGSAWKQDIADVMDQAYGAGAKADMRVQEHISEIDSHLGRDISPIDLDDRLFARRLIEVTERQEARGIEHKNPGDLTPEHARRFLEKQDAALGPERVDRINKAEAVYQGVMDKVRTELLENGLITQDGFDALSLQQHYSPLDFIQHIDPDGDMISPTTGKRISVPDSGIKKLDKGSIEAVLTNHRYLLGQVVARTEARIAKNNANKTLAKLAQDPKNPLGAIMSDISRDVPTGYEPVHYMDGGVQKRILLPSELARYWATSDPAIAGRVSDVMGWLSGANLVRALATGYNPEFAWRNVFMDSAYTWFRTDEYSKWLPVAMGQRTKDLLTVTGDAWRMGKRTQDFIGNYGSMDFLSNQGGVMKKPWQYPTRLHSSIQKAEGFFSKLNTWSELTGRLATQERHIINELSKLGRTPTAAEMAKIKSNAALAARNVIDFNKGGSVLKAVDRVGFPYLNAAFRAVDGLFEAAAKNPALFSFKVGQLALMSSGLAYWAWKTSPKTMESIPDREREGYWILPLGDIAAKDDQGNPKYLYLRFRKDQAGRAIAATAETFTEKLMGRKVNGNRIAMGLSDLSPVDLPQMMFPLVSAMNSYALNKNQWTREDIWKGAKVEPHAEYYSNTPDALVRAADGLSKLGVEVSPERLRQSGARVFPYNAWTSMMGGAVDALVGRDEKVRQTLAQRILEFPGVRTILGSTREFELRDADVTTAKKFKIPITNPDGTRRSSAVIRNEIDDATVMQNTKRQLLNNELDRIIQMVKAKQANRQDAVNWIMSIEDFAERPRLMQRLKDKTKVTLAMKPPPMP